MQLGEKKEITRILARYISAESEGAQYDWSDGFYKSESKNNYTKLVRALRDRNIDFKNLTQDDAYILGFGKSDKQDLWYIPLYLYDVIPNGTEVYTFDGSMIIKTENNLDNDNRAGYLAYRIKVK